MADGRSEMGVLKFEDLDAWGLARALVRETYQLTRRPGLDRDFGLSGQLQRAAVSIMSNIAEGFERKHKAEKSQAYNVARASCGEARSLLYVVGDLPRHHHCYQKMSVDRFGRSLLLSTMAMIS